MDRLLREIENLGVEIRFRNGQFNLKGSWSAIKEAHSVLGNYENVVQVGKKDITTTTLSKEKEIISFSSLDTKCDDDVSFSFGFTEKPEMLVEGGICSKESSRRRTSKVDFSRSVVSFVDAYTQYEDEHICPRLAWEETTLSPRQINFESVEPFIKPIQTGLSLSKQDIITVIREQAQTKLQDIVESLNSDSTTLKTQELASAFAGLLIDYKVSSDPAKIHKSNLETRQQHVTHSETPMDCSNNISSTSKQPTTAKRKRDTVSSISKDTHINFNPLDISQTFDSDEICTICQDKPFKPTRLNCGHVYCDECVSEMLKSYRSKCPVCECLIFRNVPGQPRNGKMSYDMEKSDLNGYEGYGTIVIRYDFSDGIQTYGHPMIGKSYSGSTYITYLPNNEAGREIHDLLTSAFHARVLFAVKRCRPNEPFLVLWNGMPQKTNRQDFPDDGYFDAIRQQLHKQDITDDMIDSD
ncbi:DgyrCDS11501 [Dimorphilus gyrociliatus]|uniref:E3 ubiquitin-protein ligase n=1 Tax=Dimorphilus gyrociliatus TaxID=2664684 RepID=A0A7I8W5E0_9ANNE|nr:DgyrCDS11501 [Dimorphilus gyrociliatus]